MIDPGQFRKLVIDPSIRAIGLWSPAASELLLGTAIQESRLTHLAQLDGDADPYDDALGLFQTEKATIVDIWENYLAYRPGFASRVLTSCHFIGPPEPREVVTNLRYAAVMARLVYFRDPEPLPEAGDLVGQAMAWKRIYNTQAGHGSASQYVENVDRALRQR